MNAPQILILFCIGFNLLTAANKHGQPKEGVHHFAFSLVDSALTVLVLYWGGFFP